MDQLPKRSQEIVLLIIEGLPRKEVGAQMQLGERQIHRLYNAAIERLGELMSEPKEPPHDE
jgi:DNA-directed RNA polymerase specialized sigma subunit